MSTDPFRRGPRRVSRPVVAAAATACAAVVLVACGGGEDFNDADVAFATDMIPHHAQALEMARLVDGKDVGPEIMRLADDVESAQDPEIETMTGWLEDWDQPAPGTDADHSGDDMAGMMSSAEMSALEDADGEEFERLWTELMIEHHEGAVEMARTQQDDGRYQPALDLAEEIERSQADEIAVMESLLRDG